MKPFRIFRPGKHRAACGTVVEFTEDDLKRAVAAYSPVLYAAPLVIGHPKTEDRAYGWAESLTYDDGHAADRKTLDDGDTYFTCAGWCGRLDLAGKLAGKHAGSVIVEAVTK